jgi:hypothetical protein
MPQPPAGSPLSESAKDFNKPEIKLSGPQSLDTVMQTPELEVPKPPSTESLPHAAETVSLDKGEATVAETPTRSTVMDQHLENLENEQPEKIKPATERSGGTKSKKPGFWNRLLKGVLLGRRRF